MESESTSDKPKGNVGIGKIFALVLAWTILSLILEAWFSKPVAQGLGHFIVALIAYPALKTSHSPLFVVWVLYCIGFGLLIFLAYKYL
jgi:hypothetical protein